MTAHRLAVLDLPEGNAMRAPGEAPGMLALEIAMDELAEQLKLDPVELRIRNDVQFDPEAGPKRPFSHRNFIGCLKTGAERFGWDKRNPTPGPGPRRSLAGRDGHGRGLPQQPDHEVRRAGRRSTPRAWSPWPPT
jgi:CO/xanthine dehydrogenase Mo-binding subunit